MLSFEQGGLRCIRLGEREVVRRLYLAVRDQEWGTLGHEVHDLHLESDAASFRLSFQAEDRRGEVDFHWQASISGDAQGTIAFSAEGLARSSFWANRIGFCLLHPGGECAGRDCIVEHSDGSRQSGRFPLYIAPHQPFLDIRAIAHEVAPGVWAEARFQGDIFEMEDQRNWTDASFKTYSRPLSLPYPFRVEAGSTVRQSVRISLQGQVSAGVLAAAGAPGPVSVAVGQAPLGPLPRLALAVASGSETLSERDSVRLRALRLSHLHLELNLGQPAWRERLRLGAAQARDLALPLVIATVFADEAELAALRQELERQRPHVCAFAVFHEGEPCTSSRWVRVARRHLQESAPAARFGGGSRDNFTELNRGQAPGDGFDFVGYSLNPQVHAFDNASLMETLEGQAWTISSARRLVRGLPLAVGPVTLRKRPASAGDVEPEALARAADPRQMSLFGAAWTLGSLQRLAEGGVEAATYYETVGCLGVMAGDAGARLPGLLAVPAGAVYPLYHVFADIGEIGDSLVLPVVASDSLKVAGLALRHAGGTRLLLASLVPKEQEVVVAGFGPLLRLRRLDEGNAEQAMLAPEVFRAQAGEVLASKDGSLRLSLPPYALARLDSF